MCGIAGQFNFQRREPVERETIVRMARSIAHRGPDDEGFFISGPVGLGFRRLSIIDLAGGHQPMSDAEETVWVIFNGEIYNYKELRAELQGKGHQFRTNSDTEVIIHGYKEWGTDVFNRLNGMFGLAIWDVPNERLVLARDAMGIKLIYYKIDNGTLTFGSEIRPILAAQDITTGCRSYRAQSVSSFSLYAFSFDDISRHSKAGTRHDAGCRERTNAAKNAGTSSSRLLFRVPREEEEAATNCLNCTEVRSSVICSATCRSEYFLAAVLTRACCWR